MKAPITVDITLLAQALGIRNTEAIAALKHGVQDAATGFNFVRYPVKGIENNGIAEPFIEWAYHTGLGLGEELKKQPGRLKDDGLIRPHPKKRVPAKGVITFDRNGHADGGAL